MYTQHSHTWYSQLPAHQLLANVSDPVLGTKIL